MAKPKVRVGSSAGGKVNDGMAMIRGAVLTGGLADRSALPRFSLLLAVTLLIAGCVFPADPRTSDLGVRHSHDVLELMPALCPGQKVVSVKITDFSDDRSGAVLWDSGSSGDPIDMASVPIRLDSFELKVADSTSVLVEVQGEFRDGRIGTDSVAFALDEMPTIESNRWLSSSQDVVDEQDLTARQCTKD